MNRPYVICHMTMSIDGKVTGDFLYAPESEGAIDIYYEINREYKADAFACGRVTMEESFTKKWYPDLSKVSPVCDKKDYIPDNTDKFYAVAFDTKGSLGWQSSHIIDNDPGYGNARIIEVLTEQADARFLGYLKEMKIPYVFAGKKEIDIPLALSKLKEFFGIDKLLLEGGSIINGAFQRADVIDELSLVCAPVIAGNDSKAIFHETSFESYKFYNSKIFDDGTIWLNYRKKGTDNKEEHIRQKIIIEWSEPIPFEEALISNATDIQGLYYITRVIKRKDNAPKETSLYIGKATNGNTVKNRLKAHKQNWVDLWNGKKFVRIGKIIYPKLYYAYDEALLIDHAESAVLVEEMHKNLFPENKDKRNTFSYYELYEIENRGNIHELQEKILMKK